MSEGKLVRPGLRDRWNRNAHCPVAAVRTLAFSLSEWGALVESRKVVTRSDLSFNRIPLAAVQRREARARAGC